ncbi:transcriptional regulator, AraC family [Chitinophaga costaii]|uniref:Transcriptional regulator, AraC family n=1 Tax=Chitinophaga costaii TaxID=1335309 RepID=A0A1C4CMQ4_9BACT|nr:helix-turn-helix domain-containing protein [Chitinophaga costaii]PUZ27028.1 AraC family transcriptional regulator [Chitinophaga costaii]SCC20321.1 transcriptional regulator, AraC family [Chitinophaga costaii]
MRFQFDESGNDGRFTVMVHEPALCGDGIANGQGDTTNTIVYNGHQAQTVIIDQVPYIIPTNAVLTLMANQHFRFEHPEQLIAWQFNRNFYCIADHDSEVGCVGFLFYGIQHPLILPLSCDEIKNIEIIQMLCLDDMSIKDRMQGEMLRTLLKRLIINITRIAKKQTENYERFPDEKMDIVRKFNLLLEANFRQEHEVQFYASALNKSPKTLANLFAIFNHPAPSKLIQRRIIQEARRYLHYTQLSGKEIAYALGFVSPAHFSRFFKQHTGGNISHFRDMAS